MMFQKNLTSIYYSLFQTYIVYGSTVWPFTSQKICRRFLFVRKNTKKIRLLTFSEHREHASPVFKSLKVLKFQDIIKFSILKLIYFYFKDQLQLRVKNIFIKNKSVNPCNTRSGKMLFIPHINTTHFRTKSLKYNDYLTCNNFSQNMNNSNFFNVDIFISNIFIWLIIFYTYDTCILLRSIYQIHNLLFYSGNPFFFYINPHMGKVWTDLLTIFKLLRGFSWSPSKEKLLTPSKVYTSKKCYFSIIFVYG